MRSQTNGFRVRASLSALRLANPRAMQAGFKQLHHRKSSMYHGDSLNPMEYKMNFDQLIQYKALHRQYTISGALPDALVEAVSHDGNKAHVRNVCALISVDLFEQLEHTCGILAITKRQFIEAALVECLAKAAPKVIETEEAFADAYAAAQEVA
jgi:hypothetical protein